MHSFSIQVCNPAVESFVGKQVKYLYQAIETIFYDNTEEAHFLWNLIPIRMNYKYDLPVLIDDIPSLLDVLLNSDKGSYQVQWGSNSFRAKWELEWVDGQLIIASHWDSVAGAYEDLLNSRSQIVIKQDTFLYEWKALLKKVIEAINISGIQVTNQEELELIYRLESAIARFGYRYGGLS